MHPYTYTVTLRVSHPKMAPEIITQTLNMTPVRSWMVGQQRTTPAGLLLNGVYKSSYWYSRLVTTDDSDLPTFLAHTAETLIGHRDFFWQLHDTEGRVELSVGVYMGGSNVGLPLLLPVLASLARACIGLSLDIYDGQQAQHELSAEPLSPANGG